MSSSRSGPVSTVLTACRTLLCGLAALLLALSAPPVSAHSGSTAYLYATVTGSTTALRWDLALRDLDNTLALDTNQDEQLTWGEVLAAQDAITGYAQARLKLSSETGPCPLSAHKLLQISEHAGEPYAVLGFEAQCASAPRGLRLDYQALFDTDASHRGLLNLSWHGETVTAIFAPERRDAAFGSAVQNKSQGSVLGQYFKEGLWHVWTGYDHLLFLAGLFLAAALVRTPAGWQPIGRLAECMLPAVRLVTAFTLAHALTLCLAALGVISLPTRLVESLVAATVLFAGLNNLLPIVPARRLFALCWLFGLVHGTAIAGALLELGLPAQGRVTALLGFNLGVEVAQLALLGVVVPLGFALRHWKPYVCGVLVPGSLFVAGAGLVWLLNRALALDLRWPWA